MSREQTLRALWRRCHDEDGEVEAFLGLAYDEGVASMQAVLREAHAELGATYILPIEDRQRRLHIDRAYEAIEKAIAEAPK